MKKNFFAIFSCLVLIAFVLSSCKTEVSKPIPPKLFNDNWQFILSADSSDVFKPDSDLAWEKVRLPHTPVIEPLIVNDQWQGICWYRKEFVLPAEAAGKNVFLRFEGAMNVADVWVNGEKKTTHLGGFLPFVVDFTAEAIPGKMNRVIVRLDNRDNPITGPKPLKQLDFNTYGGLYRDVFLVMENDVFITDPILENLPGNGGIFVTYPEVSEQKATIRVQTHIRNTGKGNEKITVQHKIIKQDSNKVIHQGNEITYCVTTEPESLGNNSTKITNIDLTNPELWSPATPDLYYLVTDLYSDGQLSDTDTTRIGIRRFEITRDRFAINGEEMFLRGVNRHQEYPYIGYALSDNAQYRDARLIKEAGFDYVRLSHYPHSPAFMDACDELGLVVLDAIPGWQYFSDEPAFQDQAIRTCRDMIRRDRNHACVMAWEVSLNESWMPEAFIDRAVSAAREEYPGDRCFTAGWQKYGYDIYLQARQHRLEHYEDPVKPYIVSEYGDWEYYAMNAGLAQHEWAGLMQEERSSRQLPGSGEKRLLQQAANIQEAHNDNFNTPAFADGYWSMFDYNRGYTDDLETSGIMSIFRVPKFSYYFFQSQRDPDEASSNYISGPMVKIASYWNELSGPEVRVFSNCEEVELSLNDKLVSRQKPDTGRICHNLSHPPFTFNTGKYTPGTLIATGYIDGNTVLADTVRTPGKPSSIRLIVDEMGRPPVAGVNDVVFVYAILEDTDENPVPVNDIEVNFSVSGDARVINPGNRALSEAGIATALLRIGEIHGVISVEAESEGLTAATIKFISVE
jgi:beta-galactosidase